MTFFSTQEHFLIFNMSMNSVPVSIGETVLHCMCPWWGYGSGCLLTLHLAPNSYGNRQAIQASPHTVHKVISTEWALDPNEFISLYLQPNILMPRDNSCFFSTDLLTEDPVSLTPLTITFIWARREWGK